MLSDIEQKYTGVKTSINSWRIPIVYKRVEFKAKYLIDYGCGKYTDHIREYVESFGVQYIPYDPYNQPGEINNKMAEIIAECISRNEAVDVVCSNVLNVIAEDHIVQKIADFLMMIANRTGGTVYVTVKFDKRYGKGVIGPDQYQRNVPIEEYLRFFPGATILYRVLKYEGSKADADAQ